MDEYKEGDLIEAVKGDTVIRTRLAQVRAGGGSLFVLTAAVSCDLLHLWANGYTVTLLERAPVPLPTEPGAYEDDQGCVWLLDLDGWHSVTDQGGYFFPDENHDPEEYTPFTRLVPEVTA